MIVLHKGKRIDNGEEVIGYITKLWGQYHIIMEHDENTAFPVDVESIEPLLNKCESSDVKDRPTPTFEDLVNQLKIGNQQSQGIANVLQSELDKGNITEKLSKLVND